MADVGSPLGASQQASAGEPEDPWGSLPPPAPESFAQTHFGSTNAASWSGQASFSPFASTNASWSTPQAVAGWGAPAFGAAGGWATQAALQQQQQQLAAAALQQQAWAAHAAQAQALAHQQALLQQQQQQAADPAANLLADLGVEESEEASFRWIAEYALRDDALPPPWQKHQDAASGRVFYSEGGSESSWEHPMLPHLQRIVETGRLFKEDSRETLFEEARAALWHEQKEELDVWSGPYQNHSGRTYFLNGHSGVTSFHDPRERAQFTYQVQTSLLDHLKEVLAEEAAADPAASDSPRFGLPRFGEQPEEPAELPASPTSIAWLSPTSSAPDASPGKRRGAWRRKKEETTSEEKKLAIADMRSKAVQLFTVCLEEDEVQRLQLARKAREVAQRRDGLAATAAALPQLPVLPSLFPQSPAAASAAGIAPRPGDTGSVTPRTSLTPRMAIPSPCTPRMSQEAAAREVAAVPPTTPRDVELPAEPSLPPPPPLPMSP